MIIVRTGNLEIPKIRSNINAAMMQKEMDIVFHGSVGLLLCIKDRGSYWIIRTSNKYIPRRILIVM